ncbi:hypothetical protein ACSBR2_033233 [Camellia fascicularis]
MRGLHANSTNPSTFKVTKATMAEFAALNDQSMSMTLQVGDMFVFPKGLVHYQYNVDATNEVATISALGSANAGTVSTLVTLFATGIYDGILAKSFKTNVATIQKLKTGLGAMA